ncbi:MAG: hypothetical protein PWP31_2047 [Clostridia bacterium]|nr:hypothetical protein [Clostridia bacterium]
MTKSILELINKLNPEAGLEYFMDDLPQYLYVTDPQIGSIWNYFEEYRNNEIPEEVKELMIFTTEAIPEDCFKTVQLDQESFEETAYNFIEKIKNEKERFADIMVGLAKLSGKPLPDTPSNMKNEIINDIDESIVNGEFPTKEKIEKIDDYLEIKEIYYHTPLLGGNKLFKAEFTAQEAGEFVGNFKIDSEFKGYNDNLNGFYNLDFDIISNDFKLKGSLDCPFNFKEQERNSKGTLNLTFIDPLNNQTVLDTEIVMTSKRCQNWYAHKRNHGPLP